jgi:hypothetical protein
MRSHLVSTLAIILLGGSVSGCLINARPRAAFVTTSVVVAEPEIVVVEPAPAVVVFREPPPLVLVESNVYVVENAGFAIYYVDGFYWHFGAGVWYRSRHWDEPWMRIEVHVVPSLIVHRDHRHYVRYKPAPDKKRHAWREPKVRPGGSDRDRDGGHGADVKADVKKGPDRDSGDRPRASHDDRPGPDRAPPTQHADPKPKADHGRERKVDIDKPRGDDRPKVDVSKPRVDDKPKVDVRKPAGDDKPKVDVRKPAGDDKPKVDPRKKKKVDVKKPKVVKPVRKKAPPAS